ncbi:BrnT family toxin [Rugamonas sp. DEMB1]|uniref:BrnT family toxin n=1 Tax=Rugamonas sp. DEMB1 TaxID=3039386 RepID=UPI0028BF4C29|nr:BrnT family toxin [Rugamonas sp. DEMB1]
MDFFKAQEVMMSCPNYTASASARHRQVDDSVLQIILAGLIICYYTNSMRLTFDPAKREKTLAERGLEFVRAREVFEGVTVTSDVRRLDYGEHRRVTVGYLDGRVVVVVWTRRGQARRIISMRKANEREIAKFAQDLG